MTKPARNNLAIDDDVADARQSDDIRWVRTLKNLVPGRLSWFYRRAGGHEKTVLDLGCAGGFVAEALAEKTPRVTAHSSRLWSSPTSRTRKD